MPAEPKPLSRTGPCRNCHTQRRAVLHLVIGQNGGQKYTWVCCECQTQGCFCTQEKDSPPLYISHELVLKKIGVEGIDILPVIMPTAINRCVRCGNREAELHHWAPKEIFGDDANTWPKDYLCVACHLLWHQKINAAREAKP